MWVAKGEVMEGEGDEGEGDEEGEGGKVGEIETSTSCSSLDMLLACILD